jgi:hypothetical protein
VAVIVPKAPARLTTGGQPPLLTNDATAVGHLPWFRCDAVQTDHMSDAFDGAGKGFREPSYRAALVMLLLLVVVLVAVLLLASGALKSKGGAGLDTQINPPGLLSNPPAS